MSDESAQTTIDTEMAERTAEVVSAYVTNNAIPASELPALIATVHTALASLSGKAVEEEKPEPAVDPKRSVKKDHIICLECGKKFKSIKRHIGSVHGMTPEEYRAKWDLNADYPMVAPEYGERRSALARSMGLGRKPKQKPARKKK
mgnify:CR=1 FL=1